MTAWSDRAAARARAREQHARTHAFEVLERIAERFQPTLPEYLAMQDAVARGNTDLPDAMEFFLERGVGRWGWKQALRFAEAEQYARNRGLSYRLVTCVPCLGGAYVMLEIVDLDRTAIAAQVVYNRAGGYVLPGQENLIDQREHRVLRAQLALNARRIADDVREDELR